MISGITTGNAALLAVFWQSTLFLIIGLIISFVLRNHSARAHRILLLSIIASLFVPAMTILVKHLGLGIFEAKPDTIQVVEEAIEHEPVYETSFLPLLPLPAETSAQLQFSNIETPLLFETQEEIVEAEFSFSKYIRENWRLILLFSWIAASLILTLRLLVTFLLGIRLLNKAQPLESKRISSALQRAKEKLAIKKDIKLYGSRKIKSPVIWCWRIKPVLLVPKDADRFHERIDWTGVLCHELAHWKRRDHISGLIAEIAACVLPWQLFLWLAKTRLINLSEHACDDWVIATGKTGTDYAESLLDMTPGGQMAFVPAVVRDKHGLAQRVQRILKDSCGNPCTGLLWAIMACFIACSIAVTVAFAQTRAIKPEPVETNDTNEDNSETDNNIPAITEGNTESIQYTPINFEGVFETDRDIPVSLETGADGTRKIITTKSIRFNKTDSEVKPYLKVDYRRGKGFVWQAQIELLDSNDKILAKRQTKPSGEGITSGQPVVIEREIDFLPFQIDEVSNAKNFRVTYEQLEPVCDEIGRPINGTRTDWIEGRITDPEGQPIEDAIILINEYKPNAYSTRIARIATDEDGRYKFGAVDWPYHIGVEWQRKSEGDNTEYFQVIELKPVLFGQNNTDFKFEWLPFPKGSSSISGNAADQSGTALVDYKVSLIFDKDSNDNIQSGDYITYFWINKQIKNEEGSFEYDKLPEGKYKIWIIPNDKKRYEWPLKEIELAANEKTEAEIEVISKHKLYGRVLFEDGTPAIVKPTPWPGAKTSIVLPVLNTPMSGEIGTIDEEGYFVIYLEQYEFDELESGKNKLQISLPEEEEHYSKTVGEFPFELLSENKETAGTIKVKRLEISLYQETSESDGETLLQKIFEIRNWDTNDMAAILNAIIKNRISTDSSSYFQNDSITLIPYQEKKWIIVRAPNEEMEFIEEWINKLDSENPDTFKNPSLSEIEDNDQVVTKIYKIEYGSPATIAQKVLPLLSDTAFIRADEQTGSILIADKVSVLEKIESIISELDKENEPDTPQQIFEVGEKDPALVAKALYGYFIFKVNNDKPVREHYETATISLVPVPDKNWIIARAPNSVLEIFENMLSRILSENTSDQEIENNLQFRPEIFSFNKQDFSMNIAHLAEKLLSKEGYLSAEQYEDNSGTITVIDKPEVIFEISKILNNLNNAPDSDTGIWVFKITYKEASEIVQSLNQILKNQIVGDEIILIPDPETNTILVRSSIEYRSLVNDWIAKLDRKDSYLPESWDLYYDNGLQPDGSKKLPEDMTEDLVSLEIFPRPLDVKDYSWKDERFDFRVYSLDGTSISTLMVRSEPALKNANRKVFQPGTYFLQFERNIRDPNITYRTICDSFIIEMNRPGIYKLYFAPKFGYGEISGSADGCYAVNFEQIDSEFPVRGDTYINREKEFHMDGLPDGKYRISAVDQQSNGNVVVSRAWATIEDESKVTLDIAEPPKGDCSLSGSIFGKQNTYTVGDPANPTQSKGEWFVLLRAHGSGEVTTTNAYEAITMDSIYVIRGDSNIVQETPEKANFKIEGIAPSEYNVTVIEKPNYQGVPIIRQQSKLLIISQGKNAVMNFDFRENKEPEVSSEPLINIQTSGLNIDTVKELLTKWTGKEVIASDEAKDLRLTIYSPEKLTKSNAINLLYNAINSQGFVVEETEDTIYIKPGNTELKTETEHVIEKDSPESNVISEYDKEIFVDVQVIQASDEFLKSVGMDEESLNNSDTWSKYQVDYPNDANCFIIDSLSTELLRKAMESRGDISSMRFKSTKSVKENKKETLPVEDVNNDNHWKTIPFYTSDPQIAQDRKSVNLNLEFASKEFEERPWYLHSDLHKTRDNMLEYVSVTFKHVPDLDMLIPDNHTLLVICGEIISARFENTTGVPILKDLPVIGDAFSNIKRIKTDNGNIVSYESGVPVLRDIPLIGEAFRKPKKITEKKQLLLITPHILSQEEIEAQK